MHGETKKFVWLLSYERLHVEPTMDGRPIKITENKQKTKLYYTILFWCIIPNFVETGRTSLSFFFLVANRRTEGDDRLSWKLFAGNKLEIKGVHFPLLFRIMRNTVINML